MSVGSQALFVRDGGEVVGSFAPEYAVVLRQLMSQSGALLARPVDLDDPGIARLFPDVYPDSDEESAEFRRLTESELRTDKVASADTVLATLPEDGGDVHLDDEQAGAWLRAINDVRLLIGTRLDLTDDTDIATELDDAIMRDPQSRHVAELATYGYLTEIQESLVLALSGW